MIDYFWYFVVYGVCGYGLEKLFAAVTRAPKQVRKGFLLLPICPVYGLGMGAVLLTAPLAQDVLWQQLLWGGTVATAVEYAVHWGYEALLGVRFWDYSATKMDVNGRICMPFSIAWGILTLLAVRYLHPWVAAQVADIPRALTYAMALLLTADAWVSARILALTGDTEALGWLYPRRRAAQ